MAARRWRKTNPLALKIYANCGEKICLGLHIGTSGSESRAQTERTGVEETSLRNSFTHHKSSRDIHRLSYSEMSLKITVGEEVFGKND